MNIDVLKAATSGLESGKKTALATVTQVNGSAPGITGAMMVVFENGTQAGTIGGGKLEHAVISSIHKAFETGESFEFDYDLSKDGELEMVCGGRIKGFVNMLLPNRRLIIFGAGHVSQQIAAAASGLPFDITVVDDRAQFQSCFQAPHAYLACTPSQSARHLRLDANTFIVIATRGHMHDYEALRLVIDSPAAYIGMMGSHAKIAETKARLAADGYPAELVDRVYMPIGLDICSGTPIQIAFSIIGEILAVANGKRGGHRRL